LLRVRRRLSAFVIVSALVVVSLAAGGCSSRPARGGAHAASGGSEEGGRYKIGTPYTLKGITYVPHVDYTYDAIGIASWYGEPFHGQATANGETYDMNDLTAAHKTLPLPSLVEVTNLSNGRTIQLRVNDRGPFADERIIDISRRGAQLLGFQDQGITRVRVRILADESRRLAAALGGGGDGGSGEAPSYAARSITPAPPADPVRVLASAMSVPASAPAPVASPARPITTVPLIASARPATLPPVSAPAGSSAPQARPVAVAVALAPARAAMPVASLPAASHPATEPASVFVQVGAYTDAENVQRAKARLGDLGAVQVASLTINGLPMYRVRLGPYVSDREADRTLARAVAAGFTQSRVVYD
jgi:peptidoglycan lytic transglycosylase